MDSSSILLLLSFDAIKFTTTIIFKLNISKVIMKLSLQNIKDLNIHLYNENRWKATTHLYNERSTAVELLNICQLCDWLPIPGR